MQVKNRVLPFVEVIVLDGMMEGGTGAAEGDLLVDSGVFLVSRSPVMGLARVFLTETGGSAEDTDEDAVTSLFGQ